MKYRGLINDRLKTLETRETRLYDTYQEAHLAAENLCKHTMGDRGDVSVVEIMWEGGKEEHETQRQ